MTGLKSLDLERSIERNTFFFFFFFFFFFDLETVSNRFVRSSCSPDFGVGGVSDRLGQISPKVIFFSLGYLYGGKWYDCRKLASDVLERLPGEDYFFL